MDSSCKNQNSTLLYVKADGSNDTLNYLWDFIDNPSVLVALTSSSSKVDVIWSEIDPWPSTKNITNFCRPEYIFFSDDPIFTFGISIQKVPSILIIKSCFIYYK